jgi:phage gp45-like
MYDPFGPDVSATAETLMCEIRIVHGMRIVNSLNLLRTRSAEIQTLALTSADGRQIDDHERQEYEGCDSHPHGSITNVLGAVGAIMDKFAATVGYHSGYYWPPL